jgi:hypothetical protein
MLTIRRVKLPIRLTRKVSSQHKPTRLTRDLPEISLHFNSEVPVLRAELKVRAFSRMKLPK